MSDLLTICDLHVSYHDGTAALRGLSLAVAAGEKVALIGPNGAGKTSLLLTIMGALPFAGSITVDGIDLTRGSAPRTRSRCGMTFQDSDDQLFMPTLLDDVAFGPLNQGLDPTAARKQALQAIVAVGLAGLDSRSGHHLSGGQKRRAALATVLSMQVKLLLLDEPGSSLDARSLRHLADLLAARSEAMLLATHDLPLVRRLCSRAILIDDGRTIADGSASAILDDHDLLMRHGLA
ncbi:MAG: energy-coupling factor ABC transporter ATP-binding protein [Planctomycetaceae bacterium]|nr:energy-coupling factor ABC transporter ATP-binding protein [Planctomycetaceae bacterium]